MYAVIKEFAQCTHYQGKRFEIGPFHSFATARRECQEWIDEDHERNRIDRARDKRAPRGAGIKHAIDDGDARYFIRKTEQEETDHA